ncbi:metal ABC transporter permease [Saccharopolyspora sp. 6V]|uniref:metal ABC transporter permease n=1 Tax=Saccharopolyspora sp. 6V TaxID=2877239 RepID=UPI001CD24358|nr:metal ABC transporter permease [Saccharopolyspora sp. 6V]MCA1192856.1 metal ABC transporter permease [Saccharopolyspora sp. 6V]
MWPELDFHARVLIEIVLLAGISAVLGTHVLDRRLSYLTHALGHATFPGIATAAALGVHLAFGGFAAGIVTVGVLTLFIRRRPKLVSAFTGALMVGGFGLGTVFTSAFLSNTARNLEQFLVGQIVNVTETDLVMAGLLLVVTSVVVLAMHGRLVFSAFDPDGYRAAGHRTGPMSAIMLVLLTGATALMASQVGAILTVAFLLAAPSAARVLVRGPVLTIVLSWLLGAAAGMVGATVSANVAVPTGPAITILLGLLAAAAGLVGRFCLRRTVRPLGPIDATGRDSRTAVPREN